MAGSAQVATQRLHDVLHAVATVSADLSLEGLLERILGRAADLVGARYGYLDVLDRQSDRRIGSFATHGIADHVADGRSGHEVLVDLMAGSVATGGDGDSLGPLPYIDVAIPIHDRTFATIHLTDNGSGSGFTREDEDVLIAFAPVAGVIIENSRLHEEGERQRRWLEAAADITTALLEPISRAEALQLVADRAYDVAAADFVGVLMPADDDILVVEAVAGVDVVDGVLGERVDTFGSVAGDAARHRTTVVVPDTDREPRYQPRKTPSWPDLGSLMVLPLRSEGHTGTLVIGWSKGRGADRSELDPALPQRFADQVALVLQVVQAQQDRRRLDIFEDRDRIGRDLHDLVIQRLFAIGLMLDNTSTMITVPEASTRLSSAIDEIDVTIKDIRRTIFALSAPAGSADLRTELDTVVGQSAEALGFVPELRLHGPIDSVVVDDVREHLLAVVAETLSNVVRHARAARVVVGVDVTGDITLTVSDDGRGLGGRAPGTGLRNITDRAELLGGRCVIRSEPGRGTEIHWTVPRSS